MGFSSDGKEGGSDGKEGSKDGNDSGFHEDHDILCLKDHEVFLF